MLFLVYRKNTRKWVVCTPILHNFLQKQGVFRGKTRVKTDKMAVVCYKVGVQKKCLKKAVCTLNHLQKRLQIYLGYITLTLVRGTVGIPSPRLRGLKHY